MPKSLGIDYGNKRIGIAISDSSAMIASALCTIDTKDIFTFLKGLIQKESIDCIVVGEARNLDLTKTDSSLSIEIFIKKLNKIYPEIKIRTIDERFTSKIAFQSIVDSGINKKKRRNKSLIDKVSAAIILQDYLSSK